MESKGKPLPLPQILKQAGLTTSTSEALRLMEQGGVRIDGDKATDKSLAFGAGKKFVVQVGKRKFARVTVS